mgnify:FL=1
MRGCQAAMAGTRGLVFTSLFTLLAGCLSFDVEVVVESQVHPGIEIVCRGEVQLTADGCRAWGDELLAAPALAPGGTTRLILTANSGNARCAADFYVNEGRPAAVTAAVRCP